MFSEDLFRTQQIATPGPPPVASVEVRAALTVFGSKKRVHHTTRERIHRPATGWQTVRTLAVFRSGAT